MVQQFLLLLLPLALLLLFGWLVCCLCQVSVADSNHVIAVSGIDAASGVAGCEVIAAVQGMPG